MNEFHILGPIRVLRDGATVTPGSLKQQRLLAVLLCRPGEPVTVSALSESMWDGAPPPSARKAVQIYVHRLRQALGDADRLVHGPAGYSVQAGPAELDALRFMELLERAREARRESDIEAAGVHYGKALELWRGPAYAGLEGTPLVAEEAERLDQERLLAYEELIEVNWNLHRHAEFIPDLAKMTRLHPYRERLRAYLMVALFRVGRQAEALEVYRQTHTMLDEHLGIKPGELLESVHEAVLRADPGLNRNPGDLERMLGRDRGQRGVTVPAPGSGRDRDELRDGQGAGAGGQAIGTGGGGIGD